MKLSDLGGFVRDLFSWMDQMRQTKKSVEALEEKLDRISRVVEKLVLQAEHEKEINRLEREKLMLQLDGILARFENRLPPSK